MFVDREISTTYRRWCDSGRSDIRHSLRENERRSLFLPGALHSVRHLQKERRTVTWQNMGPSTKGLLQGENVQDMEEKKRVEPCTIPSSVQKRMATPLPVTHSADIFACFLEWINEPTCQLNRKRKTLDARRQNVSRRSTTAIMITSECNIAVPLVTRPHEIDESGVVEHDLFIHGLSSADTSCSTKASGLSALRDNMRYCSEKDDSR